MAYRYTETELSEYFYEALSMFNETLDTDITSETLVINFFTPKNGLVVYKDFCKKYFPKSYEAQHEVDGFFETIAAEAFVDDNKYGVLIREDIDFSLGELLFTFLHEISHMFCIKNEIKGGKFFDEYCMGSGEEDGYLNAGYAIWREAVADIMADSIMSEFATISLRMIADEVKSYYKQLNYQDIESKKCMSLIISYIMISREVSSEMKWDTAKEKIKNALHIEDHMLLEILRMVFEKLHQSPFWQITPEFIRELGYYYLMMLALKMVL